MASTIFDKTPYKKFRQYLGQLRSSSGRILYDDIELMEVYAIAPWIYVLDVAQDAGVSTFTFRFVGTGLCRGIGFDPTGKQLEDLDFGPGQDAWREAYRTIVKTGRPHVLSMTHYPDVPEMNPYKKGQATCLLRLAYPTFSSDDKIEHLVGVGQFIPRTDPEAGQSYEFTLDEIACEKTENSYSRLFVQLSTNVRELIQNRTYQFGT